MIVIFFIFSLAALIAALVIPGLRDLVLLAGPIALASLYLLWRGWAGRKVPGESQGPYAVIDGSNVMHWRDNTPDLATVVAVIKAVAAKGYTPGVIFDANAGYKIGSRYQDDAELARKLGLPEDRVLVVPKGTVADHYVLSAARKTGAKVVTNDRYRDWAGEFPEVAEDGFLIRGGVKDGKVWLG